MQLLILIINGSNLKKINDVYATTEPYQQFATRIRFCLDIHNTAVKSLRYPQSDIMEKKDDDEKDKLTPEEIAEMIQKELNDENEE